MIKFWHFNEKMKPDITSEDLILSSKIRFTIFSLLLVFLAAVPAPEAASELLNRGYSITAAELRALPQKQTVLLDTRSRWKYLLGHIPGAIHVEGWKSFTQRVEDVPGILREDKKWLASKLSQLGVSADKTIVLYGEPKDPWRTDGRFFWMFQRLGFQKVSILLGGLDRWKQTGGTQDRGRGDPVTESNLTAEDIRFDDSVSAGPHWIRDRLNSPDWVLIDNRTAKEYHGDTPYGSERGGHIPGARHIPWQNFFGADGVLKDKKTLESYLHQENISREQNIVVYCTGGVRSAMAYFVFKKLGYSVRNYDGSWWDWSHRTDLPVEGGS